MEASCFPAQSERLRWSSDSQGNEKEVWKGPCYRAQYEIIHFNFCGSTTIPRLYAVHELVSTLSHD